MIDSVSIIGLGLIGGSLAKAIKNFDPSIKIGAYDTSDVVYAALSDKIVDHKLNSISESLEYRLIFICTPLEISLDILSKLAAEAKPDNIISDVCGIKGALNDIWEKSNSKGTYIGAHPMTGKEKGGYENSDPILFENAIYIVSTEAKDDDSLREYTELITSLGARVMPLDPYIHDEVVANVSHMPQLLSVSLMNALSKNNEINYMDFAGGGFRDMTRIASSAFDIWESVIKQNKEKIVAAINSLISELKEVCHLVENSDMKALADKFENSRKKRDEIPLNAKGFLNPLFDIFVFVNDEPGVISKISTKLFNENINIKDIELLKIREGTGGTFRLSFESELDATRAKEVLSSIGFSIKNH